MSETHRKLSPSQSNPTVTFTKAKKKKCMTSALQEFHNRARLADERLQAKNSTSQRSFLCNYKTGMTSTHSVLILRNKGKRTVWQLLWVSWWTHSNRRRVHTSTRSSNYFHFWCLGGGSVISIQVFYSDKVGSWFSLWEEITAEHRFKPLDSSD